MAHEFSNSVHYGIKLSKRIYYGKSPSLSAPKPPIMEKSPSIIAKSPSYVMNKSPSIMDKSPSSVMDKSNSSVTDKSRSMMELYLPTAPMVYAVITEPMIVDNPEVPSYQPYVHGKCDPPALIPLHMHGIEMEVECYLDTAFVEINGSWRLHCIAAGKSCDCRIAIPLGEQNDCPVLLLIKCKNGRSFWDGGVEVESTTRSYSTQIQFITTEEKEGTEKVAKQKDGFLLKGHIYTLKVSQVEGGSSISVRARWSQKLLFEDGDLCLRIPFNFPNYVAPVGKISGIEKIQVNVNSGTGAEITCKSSSHPVKGLERRAGKLSLLYEAKVQNWSNCDFFFSYSVCSNNISAGLLLRAPSQHDFDQRDMFCFYLFPGNSNLEIFRKQVVFIVDISASMSGDPLENTKDALSAVLAELNQEDSFNIIAFNGNTQLFSSKMELASNETIEKATEWISTNFIAEGGTNILLPLTQAIEMLTKTGGSIPLIFLITDGTVEDERDICNSMKGRFRDGGVSVPRICTFGIGSYCNHYFLQMLALIGRGYYNAAYDADSINVRMQSLVRNASSTILANITIDALENLDTLELYPYHIPDLLSGTPLVVSGRYHGNFPDSIEVKGIMADFSEFVIDVKVQRSKDVPIDRIFAKRQIDMLTAQAWLTESKHTEEKVIKMSMQTSLPSEYTRMVLIEKVNTKESPDNVQVKEKIPKLDAQTIIYLRNNGIGFGNLSATIDNLPSCREEMRMTEPSGMMMSMASNCCSSVMDRICCMCFLKTCSRLNDQCAIISAQLCAALACFECMSWCCEICFSCDDLC